MVGVVEVEAEQEQGAQEGIADEVALGRGSPSAVSWVRSRFTPAAPKLSPSRASASARAESPSCAVASTASSSASPGGTSRSSNSRYTGRRSASVSPSGFSPAVSNSPGLTAPAGRFCRTACPSTEAPSGL